MKVKWDLFVPNIWKNIIVQLLSTINRIINYCSIWLFNYCLTIINYSGRTRAKTLYGKVIIQSCSKPPTRSPSHSHCCWFIAYENHCFHHHYEPTVKNHRTQRSVASVLPREKMGAIHGCKPCSLLENSWVIFYVPMGHITQPWMVYGL